MFSSEGFNFCVKYKREIDYDLTTLAKKECNEYAKHKGCGNCPYSVYLIVTKMEKGRYMEIKVCGVKRVEVGR